MTLRGLAPLAVVGLVLAGCGGGDKKTATTPPDPVKVAAAATTAKGTAKSSVTLVPNHLGVDPGLKLSGNGTVSLREPRGALTFDIGDVLGIAGVLVDTNLKVLFDGETVYTDPPDIPTVGIPDGWLSADAPGLAGALDPGTQLRQLARTGGFEEVGREKINGVAVKHFHGKDGDIWIDGQNLVRRIRTIITLTEGHGPKPGTLDVTTDLSEYGAPLTDETPKDATDITKTVQEILSSPDTLGTSGSKGG